MGLWPGGVPERSSLEPLQCPIMQDPEYKLPSLRWKNLEDWRRQAKGRARRQKLAQWLAEQRKSRWLLENPQSEGKKAEPTTIPMSSLANPRGPSRWLQLLLDSPDMEKELNQACAEVGPLEGLDEPIMVMELDQTCLGWLPAWFPEREELSPWERLEWFDAMLDWNSDAGSDFWTKQGHESSKRQRAALSLLRTFQDATTLTLPELDCIRDKLSRPGLWPAPATPNFLERVQTPPLSALRARPKQRAR